MAGETHGQKYGLAAELGRRVAFLRKHAAGGRMTQERLAGRLSLSLSDVRKIESGDRPPNVTRIEDLAQILGVTPHDLVCEGAPFQVSRHVARFADLMESYGPNDALAEMLLVFVETFLKQFADVKHGEGGPSVSGGEGPRGAPRA